MSTKGVAAVTVGSLLSGRRVQNASWALSAACTKERKQTPKALTLKHYNPILTQTNTLKSKFKSDCLRTEHDCNMLKALKQGAPGDAITISTIPTE